MIMALGIWMAAPADSNSVALGQIQEDLQIEFRIDTDIYSDESKPPIHNTQTMFLSTRTIE